MLVKKLLVGVFLLLATSTAQIYSVQVLPAPRQGAGAAFGKGFGDGFSKGMESTITRMQHERNQKKIKEERAKQIEHERYILEEILKDYDPSRHSDFVMMILQSELSNDTKHVITDILNEQYKLYLEKQKAEKGLWSWFRK